jgi:hypothetical protein
VNREFVRRQFLDDHRDLPPSQIVALIGSHRRVSWPPLCPACGAPAASHLEVAKIFGRRTRHAGRGHYRFIVRMQVPFCQTCAERHRQLLVPVPSLVGSFFRTPAILSLVGAVAVAIILWNVFLQDVDGISSQARWYALGGIVLLVGFGMVVTAREARYLRVPPLTEVARACDFSDNLGFPFGRRRLYAIRNAAFADAFTRANHDRLLTDAIRTRDTRVATVVFVVLMVAAVIAWFVRG